MDVLSSEEMEALITASTDQIIVSELVCRNVVGLERWERRKEQRLFISFTCVVAPLVYLLWDIQYSCFWSCSIWADIRQTGQTDNLSYGHNYGLCASLVTQYAEVCTAPCTAAEVAIVQIYRYKYKIIRSILSSYERLPGYGS